MTSATWLTPGRGDKIASMESTIRRARPADTDRILALIETRRLSPGESNAAGGGLLEGPSAERVAEAINNDVVIVADRAGELLAVAIVMRDATFRASPWWEFRHGLSHPDLGDESIESRRIAYFELLVGVEEAVDRRPIIRVAYEALWAVAVDHDFFASATLHSPITNSAARRLMDAVGFVEVGFVEYRYGGIMVVTKIHALSLPRLREALVNPEASAFVEGVLGERSELPPIQTSPPAWRGESLRPSDWEIELDTDQINELRSAVAWVTSPDAISSLAAGDVPLPHLQPLLKQVAEQLLDGLGFALLRGLPVADMTMLEAAACFAAVGAHLGLARSQNADGDLLGHVRDLGLSSDDPDVRIYQTHERQTFHTDSTDVVGLCCLRPAERGGDSLLVSALTIYNEMLAQSPALTAELFEPVATDRRGEVLEGQRPYFEVPPFSWYDDHLSVLYQRQYIESAQRFDEAPRISDDTRVALDLFDRLANDTQLSLTMRLEAGDMQFVNNHVLLHDRTAFVDDPATPRHLLRLWLSMPGDRVLPPIFADRYGSIEVGDRGGIPHPNGPARVVLPTR